MYALTLKDEDPNTWATWVRDGKKDIETRKWKTAHRGDLLITCSKSSHTEFAGKAIAVVDLFFIDVLTFDHLPRSLIPPPLGSESKPLSAWFFRNIRQVVKPFDVLGERNVWWWPGDIAKHELTPAPQVHPPFRIMVHYSMHKDYFTGKHKSQDTDAIGNPVYWWQGNIKSKALSFGSIEDAQKTIDLFGPMKNDLQIVVE